MPYKVPDLPGFPGIPDISKLVEVPEILEVPEPVKPPESVDPPKPVEPVALKCETITAPELAAYWGVSSETVHAANRRGKIPGRFPELVRGRVTFNREEALEGWVPAQVQSWTKNLTAPGNFLAGGSGLTKGGGRTAIRNAAVARLHDLHLIVTPERWKAIILEAVVQAEAGDRHARKWLGDYLMGPPVQRIEAEVDVSERKSFTDDMRAQAIEVLLRNAQERVTIDVEPNEPDTD